MDQNEVSRYLDDVVLIKRTLQEKEGQILMPSWVFYLWGVVIAGTTLLCRLAALPAGWGAEEMAWKIWIPAVVVGGLFETVGWVQFIFRENRVVWTESMQKLLFLFSGMILALAVLILGLVERGTAVNGVVLLSVALCLMTFGAFSYKSLMIEGYLALGAGAVVMIIGWSSPLGYTVSGLFCALLFAAAGVHTRVLTGTGNRG